MNPDPITREEMFMDAIQKELSGESGNPGITPVTRTEMFLAAMLEAAKALAESEKYNPATTSEDGLMSHTDKEKLDGIPADATSNPGTITGITMNGASKGTSGIVDLGTVLTEHQDISGKANTVDVTAALAEKVNTSAVGAANGVAQLDGSSKVPVAQLPSYVSDVLEYNNISAFPANGTDGKIYVDKNTNLTYRWSGSQYVEISKSLALGTTGNTAFPGDMGQTAYEHSQVKSGNPHHVTKSDVDLGNVDNTRDLDKPVSTAVQTALDGKANTEEGKSQCHLVRLQVY